MLIIVRLPKDRFWLGFVVFFPFPQSCLQLRMFCGA